MAATCSLVSPCLLKHRSKSPGRRRDVARKFWASVIPGYKQSCKLAIVIDNRDGFMDGWMDDLRFYVLFNSISVISGRCLDDNERLCAMELRLRMRRFHLE